MLQMSVSRAKNLFFDRAFVIERVDAATRKALSRGGAILMRSAQKSIKDAKVFAKGRTKKGEPRKMVVRQSKPGEPPMSHTGLLRDNLFFAFDPSAKSVVVGPAKLNGGSGAPSTLEFGGTAKVTRYAKGKRETKTVQIAARPYMRPALEREQSKLPEQLRNSVSKR